MKITILRNAIEGIPGDLANDVGKHFKKALLDYFCLEICALCQMWTKKMLNT